jgi:oligoendopeptidase F
MYEDPFYNVNYVYAGVLALKYYAMMQKDPSDFRTRYMALLRNGFTAPPKELLKRFLEIDLGSTDLVNDAMNVVSARVEELRQVQGDLSH